MTRYFVDATSGLDANPGTSELQPWKTISKVNSVAFNPGDMILFKRGEIWREMITVSRAGSAAAPIVYGAYGVGNRPSIRASRLFIGPTYRWTASHIPNRYYCELAGGGNPGIPSDRTKVWVNGNLSIRGSFTTLAQHENMWGDDDGLGFNTIYIRDDNGDPDVLGTIIEFEYHEGGNYSLQWSGVRDYITFQGLDLRHSKYQPVYIGTASSGIVFDDCIIAHGTNCLNIAGALDVTIRNSEISWSYEGLGVTFNTVGGSLALEYTKVLHHIGCNYGVGITNAATLRLDNCHFGDIWLRAIYIAAGAGTTGTIRNCYLGATSRAGFHVIDNLGGGVVTASYCNVAYNPGSTTYGWNNVTDGGGNKYLQPHFTRAPFPGILSIGFDNGQYSGHQAALEAIVPEAYKRGIRMYAAVNTATDGQTPTATEWGKLQTLIDNYDLEICGHSRGHIMMDSLSGFTIRYNGACTTATVTIDVVAHSLITTIDGAAGITLDLDTYWTMSRIVNAINGYPNYVAAVYPSANQNTGRYYNLADVAGANIKATTYTALFDATRTWAEEFDGCITDIAANLHARGLPGTPYAIRSWVWPFGLSNAAAKAACVARGLIGARGTVYFGTYANNHRLADINIYNIKGINFTPEFVMTNSDTFKRSAFSIFDLVIQSGGLVAIYGHGYDGGTLAQWVQLFDWAISYLRDARIMSLEDAFDHVRNNLTGYLSTGYDADGTGERWTRIRPDAGDYRLQPDSQLVGVGTPLGITSDCSGRKIRGFPDIGAHERIGNYSPLRRRFAISR